MVVRRTVERLRQRPEEERSTIAGTIAIGVSVVLFFGWAASFFYGGSGSSAIPVVAQQLPQAPSPSVVSNPGASTAAAASAGWQTATSTQ